jgi:hypothetical protein
LGQRSRKRGQRQKASAAAPPPPPAPRRSRGEERNAAVRAQLEPLAPDERPWPLLAGAAIALVLGSGTLIMYVAGVKTTVGGKPGLGEVAIYGLLMFVCAWGMWRKRYWAVLGFMTLLAIGLLGVSLALTRVTSALWGVAAVAALGAGGYLFWKLVRILSRIQMPQYVGRDRQR